MKKLSLILTLAMLLDTLLFSQQLPIFTQYQSISGLLNPAAVSTDYLLFKTNMNFGLSARQQWIRSEAAPQTQVAYGNYLYENSKGISWLTQGFLINDKVGRVRQSGGYVSLAGLLSSDIEDNGLSFGLGVGTLNYSLNLSETSVRHQDDVLATTDQSFWYPDFSLGVNFYKAIYRGRNNDFFFGGISSPQIFGLKPKYQAGSLNTTFDRVPHIYANTGYIFTFDDDSNLEFSTWLKYVPHSIFHADFNVKTYLKKLFWVGAGAGTSGFAHAEVGIRLDEDRSLRNPIKIGYSYDNNLFTKYNAVSLGSSHEIQVSISLNR